MDPHVLFVGGEDNELRIPFILAMRDRGFRVTAAGSGDMAPFRAAGIPFLPWRFDRFVTPFSDRRALGRLTGLIRDLAPDIVQGYDTKPCIYVPMAARRAGTGTRAIRTICGEGWVYSSASPVALALRPVYRALHRRAARSTAATVFEIRDDERFFRQHDMSGARAVVIPAGGGGIDVEGFENALRSAPDRQAMRSSLGLDPEAEVIVTVARMTRQKGIPALLRAAEIVHRSRPGARFLLVGPRQSEGRLAVSEAEIAAHAPYVIATGPRRDVPALLRMADLFVFPTEYREGVSRVLLEATLAGLPIISTSMPGCCEVIENDRNGLLTPPAEPEALAERILRMLNDPVRARQMWAVADQTVRQRFSLTAIADRHAALYRGLLGSSEDSDGYKDIRRGYPFVDIASPPHEDAQ